VPLDIQQRSFRAMLELAHDAGKPVLIHDRDAHDEVLAAVSDVPGSSGIMHCFSGDAAFARRCADQGFIASFSGIVTFPRAENIQGAARSVAHDGFVVETDSPFLSPVPERGKPNLPERVAITAAAVARLRGAPVAEVRAVTTRTAHRVLGIAASGMDAARG
jgi:TatD DNase family protein